MTRTMPTSSSLSWLLGRAPLRRIALVTLGFALAGVAFALLAPRWYRTTVSVVPVKQQKGGGLSSILGGDLGGLASGLDAIGGGGADTPRIAAVLESASVTDAVIEKFDLRTRYREKYQEDARKELWKHCSVKTLAKPSIVELSCEDKDPEFVQRMLTFFSEHANQVFRRVNVSSASEEVRFLERRARELRQHADETAARMREFQEKYRVIDLETQSRAVVTSLASLNAQRISKQLELDYARTYSGADEASLQQIESQLRVLERKLRELEQATPSAAAEPGAESEAAAAARSRRDARKGVFPQALDVPNLRAEMEKLLRDRKVAEATLFVALERLESARATEARDVSTFQILDAPTRPTRHSWPKGGLSVALATLLGLATAVAIEWVRAAGGVRAVLAGPSPATPLAQARPEPRPRDSARQG